MVADSKLLSICIPTYNGAKYIQNNIDIILKQIKEYNLLGVEIVVSDNCSTDKTPQIVTDYVQKFPNIIRYSRNDKNLGYGGNAMKLCDIANGRFIHLLGDDDFYSPNGLKRLYDVLVNNNDISVLVLSNYYLRNDHYGEIVTRKHLNKVYIKKDRIYKDNPDNFIIDVEDRAWPNTNLVFRKEYYKEIPDLSRFYKKDWLHLYILLYIAKKHPYCYLFADKQPIVLDRVGVQSWLNHTDGPRIYFNNLWVYSFANSLGYSPKVFDWYRQKLLTEYIKNITYRRSNNIFINIKYLIKYFKYWGDLPAYYTQFTPKFLMPIQSIFSIRNEIINSEKVKILTILGYRYIIKKIEQNLLESIHKFDESEIIIMQNSAGNLKQFVSGEFYSEMCNILTELENLNPVPESFKKKICKLRKRKLVPYALYIGDCYYFQYLLHKFNKKIG